MDFVLACIDGKEFKKLLSAKKLYDLSKIDFISSTEKVPYDPEHNLDEGSFFEIEEFNTQQFSQEILFNDINSADFNNVNGSDFHKISYLVSVQGDCVCFQRVTKSSFLEKKRINFKGDDITLSTGKSIVIKEFPDAVYYKNGNFLIFKNLPTICPIFKGIDILYNEATHEDVETLLAMDFIKTSKNFDTHTVNKMNRRKLKKVLDILKTLNESDKGKFLEYIDRYAFNKLTRNPDDTFNVTSNKELKALLCGFEQRYYTTECSGDKRLANSIIPLK